MVPRLCSKKLVVQFRKVLIGALAGKPRFTRALQLLFLCSLSFSCEWIFFSHYYFGYFTVDKYPRLCLCVWPHLSQTRDSALPQREKICFERGSKLSVLPPPVLFVLWQILRCLIFIFVQFFIFHPERARQHLRFIKIAFWLWESIYSLVHSSALHIFLNR